ncbi:uncharacterized protein K489DRAFT_163605 [Dissoconium aciculare CBS 342.82]|uniref:Uncharacterized protein n=1 Tax=Dissoconium aciculare CBS 342.82 TaxID=1314786 RepID=A0A6J3MC95_9PEZI|nr:uncharacterized protein K489DRAFT_163605 [Dissoconium aciculare CBS 342.82]KAF1825636.1 hypothetical protein K489DRAFT_163605 [Dissoconium aciculare CBS 342.82]
MRFVEEDLYINTALGRSIEPRRSSQSLVAFRVGSWPLSAPRWNTTNRQSLRCDSIDADTYHLSCVFRECGSDGLVEFDSCFPFVLCHSLYLYAVWYIPLCLFRICLCSIPVFDDCHNNYLKYLLRKT